MLSRRHFLKLAGVAVSAAAAAPLSENLAVRAAALQTAGLPPASSEEAIDADPLAILSTPPTPLGRVTMFGVDVFNQPRRNAELVRTARRDEVLVLRGQIKGDALRPHNNVWYETAEGFVYSSIVQPVNDQKNVPAPELAKQYAVTLPGRFGATRVRAVVTFLQQLARTQWRLNRRSKAPASTARSQV